MRLVGNDVVDLVEVGKSPKSCDVRFLARVFTAAEREVIAASHAPELTLWMSWAAKEVAYKIISKLSSPPVFAHRKFRTYLEVSDLHSRTFTTTGTVTYAETHLQVNLCVTPEYVHAYSGYRPSDAAIGSGRYHEVRAIDTSICSDSASDLEMAFTAAEAASIHKSESRFVRHFCKQRLASVMSIDPARLQIIRPTLNGKQQPPYLLKDNEKTDIDISLSHHGRWVAWTFW